MTAAQHNERVQRARDRAAAHGLSRSERIVGRRFGSIGLALDAPATLLTAARSAHDAVTGEEQPRTAPTLPPLSPPSACPPATASMCKRRSRRIPASAPAPSSRWRWRRPCGGCTDGRPTPGDAARLGPRRAVGHRRRTVHRRRLRARRRRGASDAPPPALARLPVPPAWRVLLLLDPAQAGLSGAREVAAFRALAPMPDATAAHLCRLALMRLLPSLAEADLENFGAALTEIQAIVGDHFAPAQGSRFASPRVAAALAALTAAGAHGAGQSSWGPTGFAFAARRGGGPRLVPRRAIAGRRVWTSASAARSIEGRRRPCREGTARACAAPPNSAGQTKRGAAWRTSTSFTCSPRCRTPARSTPTWRSMPASSGRALYRREARRCHRAGAGRDLLPPAEARRAYRHLHRRRDAIAALDMLDAAKAAMVPPFAVSLFADPGRLVHHRRRDGRPRRAAAEARAAARLKGLAVAVFGATGVVGFASGVIAALEGARGHAGRL